MEISLIILLLLFPIIDLSLDKHKLKNKSAEYIKTALILWAVTCFLLFCFYQGALSVKPPFILPAARWKIYFAIFFFIVFIAYMQYVVFSLYKNNEVKTYILENIKKEDDSLADILPSSRNEFLLFTMLVSVSAGICEELIFRWYLYNFIELKTEWIIAVIASSFVFGLWHLYLGWRHVIKTTLVGIFLCGVYLYFESILIAIITHILMDVYSGTIAYHSKKAASDPISGK
jgi:membrane protease YdiL (CAAX protease family)